MDKQLEIAMKAFFFDPAGWTTEEIYHEYVSVCEGEGVEPRPKSVLIREICKEFDCSLKEVKTKYFIRE